MALNMMEEALIVSEKLSTSSPLLRLNLANDIREGLVVSAV